MSLTADDKAAVRRTWELCKPDVSQHGIKFYTRLLTDYPQYHHLFKFKDVKTTDFATNPLVKAQGEALLGLVNAAVENMENADVLKGAMKGVATTHKPMGLKMDDYDVALKVLAGYLGDALGEHFDAAAAAGWTKVIAILRQFLQDCY